jgi:hypothetical protein
MVDFPGPVSLIHAGLDVWPYDENKLDHEEFRIEDDERLADRLQVAYFVQPPDFRYSERGGSSLQKNLNLRLPFLRFPSWHVCPRCGRMHLAALHDRMAPICEGPIGTGADKGKAHKRRKTIQVRFITACAHGHLQDFPWYEWLFHAPDPEKQGWLRLATSGSASLAGVKVQCEVLGEDSGIRIIESRTLAGAFNYEAGESTALSKIEVFCRGHNPALAVPSATAQAPGCGAHLYPLLRGGSNVYFPHVVSSIYLPAIGTSINDDILEILENRRIWSAIKLAAPAANGVCPVDFAKEIISQHYPDREISAEELANAATRKLHGREVRVACVESDEEEQKFRREEYNLFSRDITEGYPKTNLLVRNQDITAYGDIITQAIERVALLHKLRETRAFTGFSRIFPDDDLSQAERRAMISRIPKVWLPAVVVRGEGIFLKFREDRIADWLEESGPELQERIRPMQNILDQLRGKRHQTPRRISPRFVMLHTLSHLLINRLVYECGYGSAALRERLYYSDDAEHPMAGILVYTAAGDSEGTMGGLVRMGKSGKLEAVFAAALESAKWCSTDPVCIESPGQGPDNCNLAACHSCALLPETSCEEQNRFLDRGMVVGTLTNPEIGFFVTR